MKVTSSEHWHADLMCVLNAEKDYWELYPIAMLYSVDFPEDFEAGFEKSIRHLAGQIRQQGGGDSFQKSRDLDGLNIVQLVEAQKKGYFIRDVDFRPAMRELNDALVAMPPESFKKEREAVGEWILANH